MIRNPRTLMLLGAVALLLLPLGLAAQTEGYDPMLQITHQIAKPNLLIVLDVTGSMAYEQTSSTNVGLDSCGLPKLTWTYTRGAVTKGAVCGYDRYGNPDEWYWVATYTYTLNKADRGPSRMDVFKNALGNSLPLYDNPTFSWPASWPTAHSGWTYIGSGKWTKVATSRCSGSSTTPPAPGPPFTAAWGIPDYSQSPVVKATIDGWDPDLTPSTLPQDLVGQSKRTVNWGLMTFSTDGIAIRQYVRADDRQAVQDTVAAAIEGYLKPLAHGGLNASGTTCTSKALNFAKQYLADTYNKYGPDGTDLSPVQDDMVRCGRVYGSVLVTDGQSNMCNNSYCNADTSWGCDSSYANWNQFPAGRSNETFVETTDVGTACTTCRNTARTPIPVRTFVIGVSDEVARCELNLVAYFGRTDASSPNGDAGMKIQQDYVLSGTTKNYRLPLNVPSNYNNGVIPTGLTVGTSTSTSNYRAVSSTCTTDCKDYAFFATNPSAVYDAFATILAAIAAGDYTTSAPIASSALSTGTVALLASAEYPGWKGHLYAFDMANCDLSGCNTAVFPSPDCDHCTGTVANPIAAPPALKWDAGAVLNSTSAASRKIYTWNTSNQLVEITSANAATLNTLCGSCGITSAVVDFIRGNDGAGVARPWKLGSVVNSTPAVTQAVETFRQGNVKDHSSFETTFANRTPLVWVGADDGMLHAFRLDTGAEVIALMPPNMLALQPTFKSRYNAVKAPTGQKSLPQDHVYGVAGAPRYGDVWFSAANKYKTVLLLSEGPGGNLVAGIDVTSPVSGDTGSYMPVVLWSKTGADIAGLFKTWSTPSAGASSFDTWKGIMGAGFNSASTKAGQVDPKVFIFNPVDGSVSYTGTLGSLSSPSPWVGNQSFCDSVIYQMNAKAYYPDNLVNLGIQPDLNGQIWFIPAAGFNSATVGINATTKAGEQQPIYYPPAVNAYQSSDVYAFGSGTFYESAFADDPNIGTTGDFHPSLFIVAKDQTAGAATVDQIQQIVISTDLYVPEDLTADPCNEPSEQESVGPAAQILCKGQTHVLLGPRTQLSAPPALFVPIGAAGSPVAVFLLYDPDTADCAGTSYVIKISFDIVSGAPHIKSTEVYSAGSGAASGFAVAGSAVIVAKSGVGEGQRAGISKVPGLNPTEGLTNPVPVWWREVK